MEPRFGVIERFCDRGRPSAARKLAGLHPLGRVEQARHLGSKFRRKGAELGGSPVGRLFALLNAL
jgi:hypothetical protein